MDGGAPLSYPAAQAVAAGLVHAAGALDELAVLAAHPEAVLSGKVQGLRCRWYLLAALDVAYPRLDLPRMGRWLGCEAHIYTLELGHRRRHRDWDRGLEMAIFQLVAP